MFPYIFPLQAEPYSEVSAIVTTSASRPAGCRTNFKGKKITVIYHGSPYRQGNHTDDSICKKYGFQAEHLRSAAPRQRAGAMAGHPPRQAGGWVILRGWGVMNPVAIKTAQKVGYPANRVIGDLE